MLGTNLNSQNKHEQVKKQIIAGDKCLFTLLKCFILKLLLNKSKIRLDEVIAKPIMFIERDTSNIFSKTSCSYKKKTSDFKNKIKTNNKIYIFKESTINAIIEIKIHQIKPQNEIKS